MAFNQLKNVVINDYVAELELTNGRKINNISVRKTTDNDKVRYNINLNNNSLFFSLDVNKDELPDLTEILLWIKDNLNALY